MSTTRRAGSAHMYSKLYTDPAFGALVKQQRESGATWAQATGAAGSAFGYTGTQNALRKWWNEATENDARACMLTGKTPQDLAFIAKLYGRDWQGYLKLSGDIAITADWHMPHFCPVMAERLVAICGKMGIRQLAIVGDFLNFDGLSRFDPSDPGDTVQTNKDSGEALLRVLLRHFDRIYWILGNHDKRYLRALGQGMDLGRLGKDLLDEVTAQQRLICSNFTYAKVDTQRGVWRVTHPKSYSRDGGKVPSKLADKFHTNVIGFHGHHVGTLPAQNNEYVGIDGGGMFDPKRVSYIMLEDSTHPMWNRGFVIIRDGYAMQFIGDPPDLTDWDWWLGLPGEAFAKKRRRTKKGQ